MTFRFESDGVSAYDVFFRDNSARENTRLNAVSLSWLGTAGDAPAQTYRIDINDADLLTPGHRWPQELGLTGDGWFQVVVSAAWLYWTDRAA